MPLPPGSPCQSIQVPRSVLFCSTWRTGLRAGRLNGRNNRLRKLKTKAEGKEAVAQLPISLLSVSWAQAEQDGWFEGELKTRAPKLAAALAGSYPHGPHALFPAG